MDDEFKHRKSAFQVVFEGLVSARWWILAMVVVVITASYFGALPSIPSLNLWQGISKSIILGFVIGAVFLYFPTAKVFKMFYNPRKHWLFVLNSSNEKKPISLYDIGVKKFEQMTVEGKKLKQFTMADGNTGFIAVEYDEEENKAVNNWMGEVDEQELLETLDKVEEHRRKNLKWARIGRKLYTRFDKVFSQIEANFWKQKSDKYTASSGIMSKDAKKEIFEGIEELEDFEESETTQAKKIDSEDEQKTEIEENEESGGNEQQE